MITFEVIIFFLYCSTFAHSYAVKYDENNVAVGFHLYTKSNPAEPQTLETNNLKSFKLSNFNPLNQIKIFIHGYRENYSVPDHSSQVVLKGFQCNGGNFNVILIEYKSRYGLFAIDYLKVLSEKVADIVAKKIADFIEFIKKSYSEITNKNIDLIGFSLGGQLAGLAGHLVNGKLNSIAALDPAVPNFYHKSNDRKLDKNDADYVEIIHTSFLVGGNDKEIVGTSDIFINYKGSFQPGCIPTLKSLKLLLPPVASICNHNYAPKIFVRSLCEKQSLMAFECTKTNYYNKNCKNDLQKKKVIIGGNPLTPKTGRYFYKT